MPPRCIFGTYLIRPIECKAKTNWKCARGREKFIGMRSGVHLPASIRIDRLQPRDGMAEMVVRITEM